MGGGAGRRCSEGGVQAQKLACDVHASAGKNRRTLNSLNMPQIYLEAISLLRKGVLRLFELPTHTAGNIFTLVPNFG